MRPRPRPLTLAVLSTTALLLLGAALATLGAFDDALRWDLFSPRVESVLRGVFTAAMVLAAFGVGITVVLGIHSVATAIRTIADGHRPAEPSPRVPLRHYVSPIARAGLLMVVAVVSLSLVNLAVTHHRDEVFTRMIDRQMEHLSPLIAEHAASLPRTMEHELPEAAQLAALVGSLHERSFVARVDLLLDSAEGSPMLWRFDYDRHQSRWRRHAMPVSGGEAERAVARALDGDARALSSWDAQERFVAYTLIDGGAGHPPVVVRVEANRRADLHEAEPTS